VVVWCWASYSPAIGGTLRPLSAAQLSGCGIAVPLQPQLPGNRRAGLGRCGFLVCVGDKVGWLWLGRPSLPPGGLPVVAPRPLPDAAEEGNKSRYQQRPDDEGIDEDAEHHRGGELAELGQRRRSRRAEWDI